MYHLVQDRVECEYRGKIEIKGKGEVDIYYVKGFKDADSSKRASRPSD